MDSSSSQDLETTSKLLADLDLIERNHRNKDMDCMDTDLVLEVPDTPERSAMSRSVGGSSEPSAGDDVERIGLTRKTYARRQRDLNFRNVSGSSTALDDTEQFFRQARLAKKLETKPSPQTQIMAPELEKNRVFNERGKSTKAIDLTQNSPFPLSYPTRCRDSISDIGKDPCSDSETGLPSVGSSLPSRSVGRPCSRTEDSLNLSVINCKEEKAGRFDEVDVGLKYIDKGKGINLCSDLVEPKTEHVLSKSLQSDALRRTVRQRRLVSNGYISPCKSNIPSEVDRQNVTNFAGGETCSSFAGTSNQDNGKGMDLCIDSHPKTGETFQRKLLLAAPPRNTGQRRLVRNGCISPYNIAQGKNVAKAKEDEVGKLVFNEISGGISSHQIHIVSPDSGANCANRKKEKMILDDNVVVNGQHIEAKPQSGRVYSVPGKEVTVIADTDGSTVRSSENIGWRTTRNRAEKTSDPETTNTSNRKGTTSHSSNRSHEIARPSTVRASSETESEIRRHPGSQKHMKGKRKCSSTHSHLGECSTSTFDDLEILYLRSSGQPSNPKSTRSRNSQHRGIVLGPVIEVDELHSPEARCSDTQEQSYRVSDGSGARARQVESDEVLARQLQEQFYHESPGIGGSDEIDASIALSLQEEEDARRAASIARRRQSHPRDPSMTHLYAHPRPTFRNSSTRSTNHARMPASASASARMAQLRRSLNRPEMDLETRLNFLEALEASFDGSNMAISHRFLNIQRDFNENDYEMLLALDDNNHRHVGASESQINSLPQSVIQTDNFEEACTICLETPSIGETIRHLPCLHKFHKECIDPWLRRRTTCPICKNGIT